MLIQWFKNYQSSHPPIWKQETDICVVDERNRVNCRITFPKRTREALLRPHNQNGDDSSLSTSFGLTIHFKLTEHRDDGEAFLLSPTEWLIPIETVAQIAAEYNLVLVMNTSLTSFFIVLQPQYVWPIIE